MVTKCKDVPFQYNFPLKNFCDSQPLSHDQGSPSLLGDLMMRKYPLEGIRSTYPPARGLLDLGNKAKNSPDPPSSKRYLILEHSFQKNLINISSILEIFRNLCCTMTTQAKYCHVLLRDCYISRPHYSIVPCVIATIMSIFVNFQWISTERNLGFRKICYFRWPCRLCGLLTPCWGSTIVGIVWDVG